MKKYFYELMTDQRSGLLDKIIQMILWVLSLGYGVVVALTRSLYQKGSLSVYQAPKPVVSIGNITTGGVGKTPLVIWLVKVLNQRGIKAAVLSRGYGAAQGLNDEAKMFQEIFPQVPILVGRNRKASIQKALAQEPVDMLVADDAFQHFPLKRDLDIVTIDATNPFGNGHLVPRGILREKQEALARADVFVLTKTDKVQDTKGLFKRLHQMNPEALIVQSSHTPRYFREIFTEKFHALNAFENQRAVAFCAIADPFSFKQALQKLSVVMVRDFIFMDHYSYKERDLKKIADCAHKENVNILVTTHKDAVKILPFKKWCQGLTVLSLDIDLEITQGQDELIDRILSLQHR